MSSSPFKQDALAGQVALITGGGSGMGREFAKLFAQLGAKVCIFGRRQEFLAATIAEVDQLGIASGTVISCSGDVRKEEDCKRAVDACVAQFGFLSVLINGAAGNFFAAAEKLSPKGFKTVMETDTLGTFNMCTAAFSSLKKAVDEKRMLTTCILNITVNPKWSDGRSWFQVHAASAKAAINTMGNTLALEWGQHGIRVNSIGPGIIGDTPGLAMGDPALVATMTKVVPLQRLGTKSDIAEAVVFLTLSQYVSGHNLVVDGAEWLYSKPPFPPELLEMMANEGEKRKRNLGYPARSKL